MNPRAALAALLLFALPAAAGEEAADTDHLQGAWQITSLAEDGETVPLATVGKELIKDGHVVIRGQTLLFEKPLTGQKRQVPFKIDPAARPKAIDFTSPDLELRTGIYKLDGDTLTVCLCHGGCKDRPTTFDARPGTTHVLMTLKKVKP